MLEGERETPPGDELGGGERVGMRLDATDPTTKQEAQILGRWCDFYLDGEPVDPKTVFTVDEEAGFIDTGQVYEIVRRDGKTVMRWSLDPETKKPTITRRAGKVEIRLREDAPEIVRKLYQERRAAE